ncbi:unnamed protein product [Cylindrotheca closterium]|uniref:Uncharacterized protein n=1 Tax=Cylindrotheca closterium TaxID=2856 RepID=A0AAD2CZJ0_9STRA|nr:unnamed protein product [Cylindrotheca closterium]CAJ1950939.1 unnamed protein product [Cylindrotheca closterium]
MINCEIQAHIDSFRKRLKPLFRRQKVYSNLTLIQHRLLSTLRHHPDLLVLNSDKNLRPVILEREVYVRRCLTDHLLTWPYQQLSQEEADNFTSETRHLLKKFLTENSYAISEMDMTYLWRSLESVTDPYAYFYVLAKIHLEDTPNRFRLWKLTTSAPC